MMGQGNVVMAFRKRAKKWGYENIRIYKVYRDGRYVPGLWEVIAHEPLSGQQVSVELDEVAMSRKFRHACR